MLACYDAESESYQAICKIGTGFSEKNLDDFYALLKPHEVTTKKGYFDVGDAKPDVYFDAKVVWEVLAADLSLRLVSTSCPRIRRSF